MYGVALRARREAFRRGLYWDPKPYTLLRAADLDSEHLMLIVGERAQPHMLEWPPAGGWEVGKIGPA